MILEIFAALVLLIYGVRLLKHRAAWIRIKPVATVENDRSVSIVIVARNEMENLHRLIPRLKDQTYRHITEILVVDDESTDGTGEYLRSEGVRVLRSHPGSHFRKKEGLKLALQHAKGEIILQTDADCIVGEHWVETMVNALNSGTQLVQGPLTYRRTGSLFSGVLEAEQAVLNGLAGSGIALGQPMVGNAANMAYVKDAFDTEIVLGSNLSASGDDSEILEAVAERHGRSAIVFNKEFHALVQAEAPQSFNEFFHQRLRWASKVSLRSFSRIGKDALIFSLANFVLLVLIFGAVIELIPWGNVWTLFTVKYVIDLCWFLTIWPFYRPPDCGKGWLIDSLVLVIFYPIYTFIFAVLSKFVPFKWKDQKIAPWTRSSGTS